MNHLYVLFYFINVFAVNVYSASIGSVPDIYDVVSKNFSKSCPVLSNNILIDKTSKYLSSCKDLSFTNPPTIIAYVNINKFYCIGTLVADMQLCNSITTYEYESLPQTFQELETDIVKIQKINPKQLCTSLKSLNLLSNETIIPEFANTIKVLKRELIGDRCLKFCAEYMNDNATNELCSMMYYIHVQINNVSKSIAQKNIVSISSDLHKPLGSTISDINMTSAPVLSSKILPNNEIDKNKKLFKNQLVTKMTKNQNNNNQLDTPVNMKPGDEQQHIENPKINNTVSSQVVDPKKANITKIGEDIVQEPSKISTDHQSVTEEPRNKVQSPIEKGENLSTQTKSNDGDTNKTQKIINVSVEKSTEPSALVDEKVETTTTISTEINFLKHSDTIEYDEDVDIDDTGKLNDDTNPMPDNIQDGYSNGRAEFNSNSQTVDVEEESNFFSYFMFFSVMFIAGYVVYHNKQKIMALILEGRKDRNSRRRPSTSSYRKLNSNLEEAVTSKCSGSASHVIY